MEYIKLVIYLDIFRERQVTLYVGDGLLVSVYSPLINLNYLFVLHAQDLQDKRRGIGRTAYRLMLLLFLAMFHCIGIDYLLY